MNSQYIYDLLHFQKINHTFVTFYINLIGLMGHCINMCYLMENHCSLDIDNKTHTIII